MKEFTQAQLWVESYCVEENLPPTKTKKMVAAISDLKKLGNLNKKEIFLIWDALGICPDREDETDAIYNFLKLHLN